MKWSDIAPEGTAEWCNQWRYRYRFMPFWKHQADTDLIMRYHATPDVGGKLIDAKDLNRCLQGIRFQNCHVIEFGGWRGAMAAAILRACPDPYLWSNYELCPSASIDRDCLDRRYELILRNDFLWDTPRPTSGDVFTSYHSIEHLTAEHLELLFRWLPDSIQWMYLCAPIQDSTTDEKWEDYGGTHILEIGWEQVVALLPDFKVAASGEQFRWLERIR